MSVDTYLQDHQGKQIDEDRVHARLLLTVEDWTFFQEHRRHRDHGQDTAEESSDVDDRSARHGGDVGVVLLERIGRGEDQGDEDHGEVADQSVRGGTPVGQGKALEENPELLQIRGVVHRVDAALLRGSFFFLHDTFGAFVGGQQLLQMVHVQLGQGRLVVMGVEINGLMRVSSRGGTRTDDIQHPRRWIGLRRDGCDIRRHFEEFNQIAAVLAQMAKEDRLTTLAQQQ